MNIWRLAGVTDTGRMRPTNGAARYFLRPFSISRIFRTQLIRTTGLMLLRGRERIFNDQVIELEFLRTHLRFLSHFIIRRRSHRVSGIMNGTHNLGYHSWDNSTLINKLLVIIYT